METLYRKVKVNERLPETEGIYHCIFSDGHVFTIPYLKEYSFHEEFTDCSVITHWLEEIPDNSHQIEKLEADKAELLEALEKVKNELNQFKEAFCQGSGLTSEIESLIQKHKQ